MAALDAVARPQEDSSRTSSHHRSPRGSILFPILVLGIAISPACSVAYFQWRLLHSARGGASVRKVHRRPSSCFCRALPRVAFGATSTDRARRPSLIVQLDDPSASLPADMALPAADQDAPHLAAVSVNAGNSGTAALNSASGGSITPTLRRPRGHRRSPRPRYPTHRRNPSHPFFLAAGRRPSAQPAAAIRWLPAWVLPSSPRQLSVRCQTGGFRVSLRQRQATQPSPGGRPLRVE